MEYLAAAEGEYRALYRKGKWIRAVDPAKSGFIRDTHEGSQDRCYYRGCGIRQENDTKNTHVGLRIRVGTSAGARL